MHKVSTLTANENVENVPSMIGHDLAKNVFAIHGANRSGKTILA